MKNLKSQEGFTLVELMVVVAIIGILSAVAIPNFKRYQAKTKTSEAKLQLSAVYSAMSSLQSDYDSFGTCLASAGYVFPADNNYYAVGFEATSTANNIVNANGGAGTCAAFAAGESYVEGQKQVAGQRGTLAYLTQITVARPAATCAANTACLDSSVAPVAAYTTVSVHPDGAYFVAAAAGPIDSDNATAILASKWAINENKTLQEVARGY